MAHQIRSDRPVHPSIIEVLRASVRTAGAVGAAVTLVGAMGRDVLLTHVHGVPVKRATADIDIAVAVPGWEAFATISANLLDDKRFTRAETSPNRLYFRHGPGAALPLDLVPYGPGIGAGKFLWPTDPDIEMNVAGYADATAHAEVVLIAEDLEINVVSLAGLAMLKLYAWNDRRKVMRRDAEDLSSLIRHYIDAGNLDRAYAHPDVMDVVEYDLDRAAPYLLGIDVASIASQNTCLDLQALFADQERMLALAVDLSRSAIHDGEALKLASSRLDDLRSGFAQGQG